MDQTHRGNGHLEELSHILGKENLVIDESALKQAATNTLGLERTIAGILYPGSTEEVRQIVLAANKYGLKLHPISAGMNIGYGDWLPIEDGHYVVNLRRLKGIRDFSDTFGQIRFEAGFTQGEAMKYLEEKGAKWYIDCTGVGPDGSFVGNTLEGGFGISEYGNRRANISNLEVVLGNGTVVNTGVFPGCGPDTSGSFVQSNFGIVTAMQMNLLRKPEYFESFMLKVNSDEHLFDVLAALREFRYQNVLPGIGRTANAVRSLLTFKPCPEEYKDKVVKNEDARKVLRDLVGLWTIFGAVYGSKKEVQLKRRVVQEELGQLGDLIFFTDESIPRMQKQLDALVRINPYTAGYAARAAGLFKPTLQGKTQQDLEAMREFLTIYPLLHEMSKGVPPPKTPSNIRWRAEKLEDAGLMWYAPKVKAEKDNVRTMLKEAGKLYAWYGFEMPVTLNIITPDTVTGIMSIHFDKSKKGQVAKAHNLYEALNVELVKSGIRPYRLGIQGQSNHAIVDYEPGKTAALSALKKAWDPNNVIQPGRYGIFLQQ